MSKFVTGILIFGLTPANCSTWAREGGRELASERACLHVWTLHVCVALHRPGPVHTAPNNLLGSPMISVVWLDIALWDVSHGD
jgi:hypothetical protein